MNWPNYGQSQRVRRKVFVSYHHRGDQAYYDKFSQLFHDDYEAITDNSLERRIDSADVNYIMRRIREHHLAGSSCTIVLCGAETPRRKYVDWEVHASLDQQMGLVAVLLPTIEFFPNGGTSKPLRVQDNIDTGYAEWILWSSIVNDPRSLMSAIERANANSKRRINNSRERMTRNG
ncbi:TIR domain-containing protein [Sinorhizobium meliloti]|uniref:TIR domain-containing protein n=1 Tax=Rhizobium meliloti TaxID=382 RepID=UPI003D6596A6